MKFKEINLQLVVKRKNLRGELPQMQVYYSWLPEKEFEAFD